MKNRVVVFHEDMAKIQKILNKLGFFDELFYCNDIDEFVSVCRDARSAEKTAVVCENNLIDNVVEQIKQEGDTFELLEEQALILKSEDKQMLFLPSELDLQHFLGLFFSNLESFVLTVFGKSRNSVKTIFQKFAEEEKISYNIITKSEFLHTVYYSKEVECIEQAFGENLISLKDESLAEACGRILNEKDITISIAEQFTAGAITSRLRSEKGVKVCSSIILLSDDDIVNMNISRSLVEEKGVVSKEVAFNLTKRLAQSGNLCLSVVANEEGKSFVALGNKEQIYVFSALFEGDNTFENVVNFALFRLLKYLS